MSHRRDPHVELFVMLQVVTHSPTASPTTTAYAPILWCDLANLEYSARRQEY